MKIVIKLFFNKLQNINFYFNKLIYYYIFFNKENKYYNYIRFLILLLIRNFVMTYFLNILNMNISFNEFSNFFQNWNDWDKNTWDNFKTVVGGIVVLGIIIYLYIYTSDSPPPIDYYDYEIPQRKGIVIPDFEIPGHTKKPIIQPDFENELYEFLGEKSPYVQKPIIKKHW